MNKRDKTKYEIEYEDAPSGNVTFYNYKEPLMKFEEGFGFVGALVFDTETDKVQCHFCGHWFTYLPPHIAKEHNMKAWQYKEKVGLFQNTALISESMRAKLIASGLDKRLQNLRAGGKKSKKVKEKTRATLIKNGKLAEGKNLRGTCPEQLLDRLKKIYEANKSNFSYHLITFDYLLKQTFGSTKEAFRLAGVPYVAPSHARYPEKRKSKYTPSMVVDFVKEFMTRFNRVPTYRDFRSQGQLPLWRTKVKNIKVLRGYASLAGAQLEEYKHMPDRVYYSKDDLLEFLRRFEVTHGRKPSTSDCKRRLLPPAQRYIYHFGSWQGALVEAFKNNGKVEKKQIAHEAMAKEPSYQ